MNSKQTNQNDFVEQEELNPLSLNSSSVYVKKDKQLEDIKSTAYSFLIISILGFVFLFFMWFDLLPIHIIFYMKCMYSVVLGGLLFFFFVIGVRSHLQIKQLIVQVKEEDEISNQILTFFKKEYSKDTLFVDLVSFDLPMEQLYFKQIEKIQTIIHSKFNHLDEAFVDHISEEIYQNFFPEEI